MADKMINRKKGKFSCAFAPDNNPCKSFLYSKAQNINNRGIIHFPFLAVNMFDNMIKREKRKELKPERDNPIK